jgi:hypothetical protein
MKSPTPIKAMLSRNATLHPQAKKYLSGSDEHPANTAVREQKSGGYA